MIKTGDVLFNINGNKIEVLEIIDDIIYAKEEYVTTCLYNNNRDAETQIHQRRKTFSLEDIGVSLYFSKKDLYAQTDYLCNSIQYNFNSENIIKYRNNIVLEDKKLSIWEHIVTLLESNNFKEAELQIIENSEHIEFIEKKGYRNLKSKCIQQYFLSNFFEDEKPFSLDLDQAMAISHDYKNCLISARAGSGKTRVIIARILLLLENMKFKWDSLCVLAFNRSVPMEIAERLRNGIVFKDDPKKFSKIDITNTFHKLAKDISLYKGEILAENKRQFIKKVIEHLKGKNAKFESIVYDIFRKESFTIDRRQFNDPEDYYTYIRNSRYQTLKGDVVKSKGEKWIADFLYEYGIEYVYEKCFYPSYINANELDLNEDEKLRCESFLKERKKETKPDFYLKDYNLVWEHWGINENENSENKKKEFADTFNMSWDEYKFNMNWKRRFWSQNWRKKLNNKNHWAICEIARVKKLIETSIIDTDYSREKFENKLYERLTEMNIRLVKKSKGELVREVWDSTIDRFTKLIEQFINRFQQKYFDNRDQFTLEMERYKGDERVYEFLKIGIQVLEEYENQLKKSDDRCNELKVYKDCHIDFNQLILKAIEHIESGDADESIRKIKLILIDEYQDFSELFFRFIKAIMNRNAEIYLFCVGDDWQAINRFSGANMKYFDCFEQHFHHFCKVNIATNYRSSPNIINESNSFMLRSGFNGNPAKTNRKSTGNSITVNYVDELFVDFRENLNNDDQIFLKQFKNLDGGFIRNHNIETRYLKACCDIIIDNPNKNVLILHRNNRFKNRLGIEDYLSKVVCILLEKGVYATKSECKAQISINTMHSSKGLEADIVILLEVINGVIPMYHPDNQLFEIFDENVITNMEDQKRLFYVAMTRAKEKLYILTEKSCKSDFITLINK